jgi:hypothetical protein
MHNFNFKIIISPMLIILSAVLIRLFPHPPNFAPIAAMALFGGTYLNRKYSLVIVFTTLILSDYLLLYINPFSAQFINLSKVYAPTALLHSSTIFVYGSFLLTSLVGIWLRSHKSAKNILSACLFSSILFFLITNFGVWATGMYARNLGGLWESYVMGIPFFKNTVFGDLSYTGVFFGVYELAQLLIARYNLSKVRS